ncbi:MAG TPA: hypothetical protein VGC37_02845 [Friedmanniella sp.]
MHPELYLVIYRQQERELEAALRRRLLQTCCAALAATRRSPVSTAIARVAGVLRLRRATPQGIACCAA